MFEDSNSSECGLEDVKRFNHQESDFDDQYKDDDIDPNPAPRNRDLNEPRSFNEVAYKKLLNGISNCSRNKQARINQKFILNCEDLCKTIKFMTSAQHVSLVLEPDITCCGPDENILVLQKINIQTKDGQNINFQYGFPHWSKFIENMNVSLQYANRNKK